MPTGTVSLSLPATMIRASWSAWAQISWEPACRATRQPASVSAFLTSLYFFGMSTTVALDRDGTLDRHTLDPPVHEAEAQAANRT